MRNFSMIFAMVMTTVLMALPEPLAADEGVSWGTGGDVANQEMTEEEAASEEGANEQAREEVASEENYLPAEPGRSTGSLLLIQSLTTFVGTGLVIFGGGFLMLRGAADSPLLLAMITLGLGGAMPFVSGLITSTTGVFLGEKSHLGWSLLGAALGFLGGFTLYSVYSGVFDQEFQLGLALGFIFTGNVAGSVGGYQLARIWSQPKGSALSLELLRRPEPAFLAQKPSPINGLMLNWNMRF